jgi:pimeloyl-ACP methyl ester carboxylesterase
MPFIELTDTTIHYELQGQGEPVLFIQGCGVTGSGWDPQVIELSAGFQCLTFDNRGIGRSKTSDPVLTVEKMAADALELITAMGWESAHVVGHSLGGVIAQQLALDAPERVKSLSLLCTFSKGAEGARVTPSIAWMGLKTRLGTRAMRRRAFLRMLFTPEYLAGSRPEELASSLAPVIGRDLADWPPIILKQLKALGQHDRTSELRKLKDLPTLVVSAEKDPIALTYYGRLLCLHINGARYVEIKGASHGVTLQEPRLINNILADHFRSSSTHLASVGAASTSMGPAKRSIAWPAGNSAVVAFGGSL